MCEKSKDCGFHQYLISLGLIQLNQVCPKEKPDDCPRYKFDNGVAVEEARKIFKVQNLYTYQAPISDEELRLAKPSWGY